MENSLLENLSHFSYVSIRSAEDCPAVTIPASRLLAFAKDFLFPSGYTELRDIAGVDWNENKPQFGVFYHFYSYHNHQYLRIYVACEEREPPTVPSITPLWPGANWHEREAYDLFGIYFEGHPDLRRILMWEEYPHHPLRKEFPLGGLDTPFPAKDVNIKVTSAPMKGGPFCAESHGYMSENEPRGLGEEEGVL